MDASNETLNALYKNFRKTFADAAAAFTPGVDLTGWANDIPSTGRSNLFPWLEANFRGWREWIGPRQVKELTARGYELRNRTWEDSVIIPLEDIEDDSGSQIPLHNFAVSGMGSGWEELKWMWLILGLVENDVCFDGKAFFHAGHKYGKNAIANLSESAFSLSGFVAARTAAAGWKYADGIPCRTQFTHCLHGASTAALVDRVFNKELVAVEGVVESNEHYHRLATVETTLCTGDNANVVILADLSKQIKPAIRQVRIDGVISMDQNAHNLVTNNKVEVNGRARGAYGVTFPHLAYAFRPAAG